MVQKLRLFCGDTDVPDWREWPRVPLKTTDHSTGQGKTTNLCIHILLSLSTLVMPDLTILSVDKWVQESQTINMKPNQAMLCKCSAQRSSHTEDVLYTHFRPALKQFCWLFCCLVMYLCLVVGFSSCCCCCCSNFQLPPSTRCKISCPPWNGNVWAPSCVYHNWAKRSIGARKNPRSPVYRSKGDATIHGT